MAAGINVGAYSDALVVLGTAGIVVPLVRRLGLNPVIGYLIAGALLGPFGLGSFAAALPLLDWISIADARNVSGIAELGIVFLLFIIGLELSFERLKTMRRLVFGLGFAQVAVTTAAIAAVMLLFGASPAAAGIVGVCLSLSSTAIVLDLFSAQRRLASSAGRGAFAVLLAQDLAVIPLLLFIPALGAGPGTPVLYGLAMALAQAAAAVGIIFLTGRTLMRPLFRQAAGTEASEFFLAAALFVIVAAGVVASLAGLSMALGAFVAGLLLAETEYRKAIEAHIGPFKGILLGVFFFTVGMGIDVRELVRQPVALIAGITALITLKAAVTVGLARVFGLTLPAAIEMGLPLAAGGEFAFVGIGLAAGFGLVPPALASFALALTSVTMVGIPALFDTGRRLALWVAPSAAGAIAPAEPPPQRGGHAIVVGHGRVGKVVCALLAQHRVPFIAADSNARDVARDRADGQEVYFGNALDPGFLRACGLMEATGLIITVQSLAIVDDVLELARALRPDLPIFARAHDATHAAHLYAMGATDVVPETIEASLQLSEAALVGLGVPTGPVIASIHEKRDEFRHALQKAAKQGSHPRSRGLRAKSRTPAGG
jgi:monovalent cation:H+ antiporter-2, CPA2 family